MSGTSFEFLIDGKPVGMGIGFGGVLPRTQPYITDEHIKLPIVVFYKLELEHVLGESYFSTVNVYQVRERVGYRQVREFGFVTLESADMETTKHTIILDNATFRRVPDETRWRQGNPYSNLRQELDLI